MAARVTGRWNDKKFVIQSRLFFASDDALYAEPGRAVRLAHHTFAAELPCKGHVISDVVLMRQEHRPDAAEFLDPPDERRGEARRINQDVTARFIRARNQIAPGAIARFGCEAAEIDVFGDERRERGDRHSKVVFRERTDGCGRTGNQRSESLVDLRRGLRLAIDARLIAVIAEMRGRDLAAGAAVNARVVNEEIARGVLRQSPRSVRHIRPYGSRNLIGKVR